MKEYQSKVCVAGKGLIACEFLSLLIMRYPQLEVCAIPSKSDISQDSWMPSFLRKATELSVKTYSNWKDVSKNPNLIFISLEYDEIVDVKKFQTKKLYNLHFSLLPQYRGVYTSIFPILNGEKYVGVTLHQIDNGIDTGPIVDQLKFKLPLNYTSRDLYFRYHFEGIKLLKRNLQNIVESGNLPLIIQEGKCSYYSRRDLNLSILEHDFNATALEVHNFYRSLIFEEYQLPVAFKFKIRKSSITKNPSIDPPGNIVRETLNFLEVSTKDFNIRLHKN